MRYVITRSWMLNIPAISVFVIAIPRRVILWFAVCTFVLSGVGCISVPQRDPLPESLVDLAEPLGEPNFRTWGDKPAPRLEEWLIDGTGIDAEEYSVLVEAPHRYLAISGGGANGAFGAGLLVGWSARGDRPDFTVVTGISTGALAAPFAFLGADYDEVLRELYTTMTTKRILKKRGYLSGLFGDAAMDSQPLADLLEQYMDEAMMEAIAAESEKGRSLYIGTTNLDAGRPVIWNIGVIARSGTPWSPGPDPTGAAGLRIDPRHLPAGADRCRSAGRELRRVARRRRGHRAGFFLSCRDPLGSGAREARGTGHHPHVHYS